MRNIENKGRLWFYESYDSGRKFLGERHALCNLTRENDICVFSLTPKGEKQPKYLIVKVTQAGMMGMMDEHGGAADADGERYVLMEIMDYVETHPIDLFTIAKGLKYVLKSNVKEHIREEFLKDNGIYRERIIPQEFFSVEVDPASDDPGAKIYLQDKKLYLTNE